MIPAVKGTHDILPGEVEKWQTVERVARAICERYGGGGHPVVAAIAFRPEAIEEARKAAEEIVAELREDDGVKD